MTWIWWKPKYKVRALQSECEFFFPLHSSYGYISISPSYYKLELSSIWCSIANSASRGHAAPRGFHGQRSLVGYSPWGLKELDMTEQLILSLSLSLHPLSEIRSNSPLFFCPRSVCACVCIYTILLKRQRVSIQVKLELMKQRVRSH